MHPTKLLPTDIKVDKNTGMLTIQWSDGANCVYPLGQLREACPCVECRGGHERMGRAFDPDSILTLIPRRSYKLTDVSLVGNYALQPFWDDGHHTGIYTWDYLRRLCPQPDSGIS